MIDYSAVFPIAGYEAVYAYTGNDTRRSRTFTLPVVAVDRGGRALVLHPTGQMVNAQEYGDDYEFHGVRPVAT